MARLRPAALARWHSAITNHRLAAHFLWGECLVDLGLRHRSRGGLGWAAAAAAAAAAAVVMSVSVVTILTSFHQMQT